MKSIVSKINTEKISFKYLMSTFKKCKRFMSNTSNMKVFSTIINIVNIIELHYKFIVR